MSEAQRAVEYHGWHQSWRQISDTVSHGSFCNKMVNCSLSNSIVRWIHCCLDHCTGECWFMVLQHPTGARCRSVLVDTLLRDLRRCESLFILFANDRSQERWVTIGGQNCYSKSPRNSHPPFVPPCSWNLVVGIQHDVHKNQPEYCLKGCCLDSTLRTLEKAMPIGFWGRWSGVHTLCDPASYHSIVTVVITSPCVHFPPGL